MNEHVIPAEGQDLCLFMVAGEHSGDALGGRLMAALNEQRRGRIRYLGVGGEQMAAQGLVSQFPIERCGGDGRRRHPRAACRGSCAASTARSRLPSRPSPTRW